MSTPGSPRRLKFTWLDVFCLPGSQPFTGNQLAVVHESEGLEQWQMQTIARGVLLL
jgi:predicted PhzF superfamily epimerase YddE/YHI9